MDFRPGYFRDVRLAQVSGQYPAGDVETSRVHSFGLTLLRLGGTAVLRAGTVLAGCAVAAGAAGVAWGTQDVLLSTSRPEALAISGGITGIVAGAPSADLVLTLRNSSGSARDVRRVRAETTGVLDGPAACGRDYLSMGEWIGAISVPAHGSATVAIPVAVSAQLPRECVSVTWGLAYTAY